MDDYLPKPFQRYQMVEMLSRWLPNRELDAAIEDARLPPAGAPAPADTLPPEPPAIDLATYRVLAETMEEELPALVGNFIEDTGRMLAELGLPGARPAAGLVERHAHTLKSSAAMVGALALSALARTVEAQASAVDPASLEPLHAQLGHEFSRVRGELEKLLATQAVDG
jgi:HPt (histidine-containing phosphotransfer) domain-containing protein